VNASLVPEELVQAALEDAKLDSLERFKLHYRSEILEGLQRVPRPRNLDRTPLVNEERLRAFEAARVDFVLTMWRRYQSTVRERVMRAYRTEIIQRAAPAHEPHIAVDFALV
jgi:hypothetical protein